MNMTMRELISRGARATAVLGLAALACRLAERGWNPFDFDLIMAAVTVAVASFYVAASLREKENTNVEA